MRFDIPILDLTTRAIIHIDGDAFFASCEQARNPALRGKPVVTGKERGIAASMSYEAKALGVTRAMPIWEIKKVCPQVICLPSDYETYSLLSERFYTIVRRYAGELEEYSIDECFADITGMDKVWKMTYTQIAWKIQDDLRRELGFTFSIGLAPNKVLAKVGSKWKKPYGLTVISKNNIRNFLHDLPAEKIWGIGPRTAAKLTSYDVQTAWQLSQKPLHWVKSLFSKPILEIWHELNGQFVLPLILEEKTSYDSIQKFKTFTPPSTDPLFVFAQLSKNIENACIKLRRYNQMTSHATFILRTQQFSHQAIEVEFVRPTNLPPEILPTAREALKKIYRLGEQYRATGVAFFNLTPHVFQTDIFSKAERIEKLKRLYEGADIVAKKYGKHSLFLGTSWKAHHFGTHLNERGDAPKRKQMLFLGETKRKRLNIPMFTGEIN